METRVPYNRYNEKFMQRAIELSELAYKSGKGAPIGCVIVRNGIIVGEGHNEVILRNNPTAHGEMVTIEHACKQTGDLLLENCEMYTSLQPCPMCLGAIYWAKISVVYFANTTEDASDVGFEDALIFNELKLPAEKRKIPMLNVKNSNAIKILKDWHSENNSASGLP